MFSRAKRFDYYPKPEAPTPECNRCTKHHSKLHHPQASIRSNRSSNNCKTPKRNLFEKAHSTMRVPDKKKSLVEDSGVFLSPIAKEETAITQSSSCPSEVIHVEVHEAPASAMASSVSLSTEDVLQISFSSDEHYDEVFDSDKEAVKKPKDEKIIKHINSIEKKIETQRKRIECLRSQLFSASSDEGFDSSRSPSPSNDLQQRIKHLEDVSRHCVKETLDFIVLYNKTQEEKCAVRPQDYKHLVEFCSDLIVEVSAKLSTGKVDKRSWTKIGRFLKTVAAPFKKFSLFVRR